MALQVIPNPYIAPGVNIYPDLISRIASAMGVNESDIIGRSRKKRIMAARQIFCYVLRVKYKLSLSCTGNVTGLDHASVLHNVRVISGDIDTFNLTGKVPERLKGGFELIV